MRFESWYYLILLLIIPVLHRYWTRVGKPPRVIYSAPVPPAAGLRWSPKVSLFIKYLGMALLVVALARPQYGYRQTQRMVAGIDIVMVMDVSASMNIEDLADRPRFEVAKDTISDFIRARDNDRIGFVIFSGEAFTLVPPTLDYALLLRAVKDAKIGDLKNGTAIGDGLALAVNRLKDSKAKSRIAILLTDGDNNIGQVDPATAGDLAEGYGIRVYTIAIGREGRVKLPIRHRGILGQEVTTYQWFDNALNPELLQQIAQKTKGKFYRVSEASVLESVFKEINVLEKTEILSHEKVRYEELFERPLSWGLALLFLERALALLVARFLL